MLSIDTNVLLYAQNQDCPEHDAAAGFLTDCANRGDVAVCELVLVELYQLLRNPAVVTRPLDAPEAAAVCQTFRRNRRWALIENAPVMNDVWARAATPGIARRRMFDARLALTLRHHGVDEFATRNTKDFHDFGFSRVWDPITTGG
jgi:toxin-antitoxin system PIN domain toxin